MKKFITIALTFCLIVLFSESAFAGNAKDSYCSVAKYASKDYIYYPAYTVNKMLTATHLVLAPLWSLKTIQRGFYGSAHTAFPAAKAVLDFTGKLPYLKVAGKTLLPFVKGAHTMVKQTDVSKVAGIRLGRNLKTDTQLDQFYRSFLTFKKRWGYFYKTYVLFRIATLTTCGTAKVFFVDFCVKKKLTTKCGMEDEGGFVLFDQGSGKNVASIDLTQCGGVQDAQTASRFVALSQKNSAFFQEVTGKLKNISTYLKKIHPVAKRITKSMSPLISPIKATQKAVKGLGKFVKALKIFTPSINKVLNQKVCVTFKYPKPLKTCKKIKIFKKKKKICVIKFKNSKKRFCTKVKTALKDLNKMTKLIQKPMDDALKKLINPIIKKVTKHTLKLDPKPLDKVFKSLSKSLPQLIDMMKKLNKTINIPLPSYTRKFNTINNQLKSLKNSM